MYNTLISAQELMALLGSPELGLVIIDCRASLVDASAGVLAYTAGHIAGAFHANLETDLSGPVVPGKTGRHPLPDPAVFADKLEAWGIAAETQVVAYDDAGGAIAARLWWLLGWLGHEAQAVLDGGWSAWLAAGGPVSREPAKGLPRGAGSPRIVTWISPRPEWICSSAEVEAGLRARSIRLFDARTIERYAGEVEPIDPIAGHLPSAVSLPFSENLTDGRFRPAWELRQRFSAALGDSPEDAVMYCGSGVTACHNILAAVHAGLSPPRLYAGSFSEWITDPSRTVEKGRPWDQQE